MFSKSIISVKRTDILDGPEAFAKYRRNIIQKFVFKKKAREEDEKQGREKIAAFFK